MEIDWKQMPGEDIHEINWFHINDKYSYVGVWKPGLSKSERDKRGINTYGFSARIGLEGNTERKFFKKRSEALSFAKNYMETN